MAEIGSAPGATVDAVMAKITDILPQPANTTPKSEMTGGATGGATTRYALEDHQHPRLTSTTYATLDGNGLATIAFTRSFTNKPGVVMTETDASGTQPLVCVVQSWVRETMTPTPSGTYVGAVIKGYRSTILPTLAQVSPLAVLTAAVAGVNAINTALSNLNIFGGSAGGASVSVIAVARSDMPAT